jgi:hypothetical protein
MAATELAALVHMGAPFLAAPKPKKTVTLARAIPLAKIEAGIRRS